MSQPQKRQEVLDLLHTRRSVTALFLGDPGPSEQELASLLTIAMRVPDHGKLAPWRFVVMAQKARQELAPKLEALHQLAQPDLPEEALKKASAVFVQAPLCVLVVSTAAPHVKIPLWEQELSAGASIMNLMLGAHGMGYSAQWLTGWASYDADAKALFGVSDSEKVAGFIHIGTPTTPPTERPRPALGDHMSDLSG